MGFRFQRRIQLIPGVRLNFSKSGIGASFGVPGARVSVNPRGQWKRSVGIPGTGLSYSESLPAKKTRNNAPSSQGQQVTPLHSINESHNAPALIAENPRIQAHHRKVKRISRLFFWSAIALILFTIPISNFLKLSANNVLAPAIIGWVILLIMTATIKVRYRLPDELRAVVIKEQDAAHEAEVSNAKSAVKSLFERMAAGESELIFAQAQANLYQPSKNDPIGDQGEIRVTLQAITFVSPSQTVEWKLSDVIGYDVDEKERTIIIHSRRRKNNLGVYLPAHWTDFLIRLHWALIAARSTTPDQLMATFNSTSYEGE